MVKEAVTALKNGGVVLFPTETAYGLAVDATNSSAVNKLHKLKGRDSHKTFPLIVSSTSMAEKYGHLRCLGRRLAKAYWPGPLTLVLEARRDSDLSKSLIREDGTIAMRVSSHPMAKALAKSLGAPVTATSANRVGEEAPYAVDEVSLKADFVIDSGKLPKREVSTIVRITEKELDILRQGSIRPYDAS